MKNLFKRLRSWHMANSKYDGFFMMELWTAMLIFTLVVNACRLSHDLVDWFHSFLSLFMVSFNAVLWQHDKEKTKLHTFYELLLRHAHDSEYAAIENSEQYRRWLVSANRRRKRAERKLKWYRNTLRKESSWRLHFEIEAHKYEQAIMMPDGAFRDHLLHVYYLQIKDREENKKKENQEQ